MTDTNTLDFLHAKVDEQRDRLECARLPAEVRIRLWLIRHYASLIDAERRNGDRINLPHIR